MKPGTTKRGEQEIPSEPTKKGNEKNDNLSPTKPVPPPPHDEEEGNDLRFTVPARSGSDVVIFAMLAIKDNVLDGGKNFFMKVGERSGEDIWEILFSEGFKRDGSRLKSVVSCLAFENGSGRSFELDGIGELAEITFREYHSCLYPQMYLIVSYAVDSRIFSKKRALTSGNSSRTSSKVFKTLRTCSCPRCSFSILDMDLFKS